MKTTDRLTVFAVLDSDSDFTVSVPIPAKIKDHFNRAHWRQYLDGQIECWYGCAMAALRSPETKIQAMGKLAGISRWELDRPALHSFRGHRLEPFSLRFRQDPVQWERLGRAIGVSPVKLIQATLAVRYQQCLELEAVERMAVTKLAPCPICGEAARTFTDCPKPVT
jgi:hypothetical protein